MRRAVAAALILAVQALLTAVACADGPVAVIVNRANPVDYLSANDIRKIYTNNVLYWPDGTPIKIYDLALQDPVRSDFSDKVLGRSAYRVAEEWAHLKLTNQAKNPPLTLKNEFLIMRKVASEKGAIGYVSVSLARDNRDIKIISTLP